MKNKYRDSVYVVHPGKQHSYRTAEALYNSGLLKKYITSVYNSPKSITRVLYSLSKGQIKKKIGSHYIKEVPMEKILVKCELLGVLSLIILKIPVVRKIYPFFNGLLNDVFGRKIYKIIHNNASRAVISYDYNSSKLFDLLDQNNESVIKILDVSIATRPFMQKIFKEDYILSGEQALIDNYYEIWNEKSLARVYKEIEKADYFFAPSQIVKQSLIYCGAESSKIKVIPYGTDISKFPYKARETHNEVIKLIFVGAVEYRKGIHHLLKVITKFEQKEISLKLIGAYDSNDKLYKDYHNIENIEFCGFVTHDELVSYYHDADVFVFPTLGEGFGMVVLEAMSCGLPVIISDVAGGNDAITDGIDGFEIKAGNEEELYLKIKWFLDHREKIPEMAEHARKKAEKYTWELYSDKIVNAVYQIMEENRDENINICDSRK